MNKSHGKRKTKIYNVWHCMKNRCNTPSDNNYPKYGAVGITYSSDWEKFIYFYNWAIANGYKEGSGLTLDRIDNAKGYTPENCRWVTNEKQARNKGRIKTNKSGITGVCLIKGGDSWQGHIGYDGNSYTKSFSVKKYGDNAAFNMALSWRKEKIREFNEMGAGFTENHGK